MSGRFGSVELLYFQPFPVLIVVLLGQPKTEEERLVEPKIKIKCPKCSQGIEKLLSELPDGKKLKCPSCGASISVKGTGFVSAGNRFKGFPGKD